MDLSIKTPAAKPVPRARVRALTAFPLSSLTVRVLEVEGTVQLVYAISGDWPMEPKAFANHFAGPETAGQLRAIADKLDQIFAGSTA